MSGAITDYIADKATFRPVMPFVRDYTVRFTKADGKPGSVTVSAGSEQEAKAAISKIINEVFPGATALQPMECE